MTDNKTSDLKPKIWRVILTWGLVTYCIQIIATVTGEILRGYTDWRYTIMGWLANLFVPAIAFLIGLILAKWRQPQNRLRFATIFTICAFLMCLISQVLLPYLSEVWGPWNMLEQYTIPLLVAIIIQTLISVLLIMRHNKSNQVTDTKLYIIVLSLIVLVSQALQTVRLMPSLIDFSRNANTYHTFVLPTVLLLILIAPVVLFAISIIFNSIKLNAIKSMSQKLFLACITALYVFIIINALLTIAGIVPLHNILNFWICIASYLVALIINGIIIHHLRALSV
jgi:hypothetical protein